jgi:hypothetical protein
MVSGELLAVVSSFDPLRGLRGLLFEQNRVEGRAYCARLLTVYVLFQRMYGADEAALVMMPAAGVTRGEMIAGRRELSVKWTDTVATIAAVLRIGPGAAEHLVEVAVGLIERLPQIFTLVDAGTVPPSHARELLARARALPQVAAREFDGRIAGELAADRAQVFSLPGLRERADHLIVGMDPDAAEQRRRRAETERCITFKPAEDGMAKAFALLTAHEAIELDARIQVIAGTVCERDPRTLAQRRIDGLTALCRGLRTLGCRCDSAGCRWAEAVPLDQPDPDGVVVRYRTLVHVIATDTTLNPHEREQDGGAAHEERPSDGRDGDESDGDGRRGEDQDRAGYLVGHGTITGQHARDIADRTDAHRRPFGTPDTPDNDDESDMTDSDSDSDRPDIVDSECDELNGNRLDTANCDDKACPAEDRDGRQGPVWTGPLPPDARIHPDGTITEPEPGNTPTPTAAVGAAGRTARGATGYRLTADQRAYLLMMIPRCVFPGCCRPARSCQYDHRQEYDHTDPDQGGRTTIENLQPLCLAHHQLKSAGVWLDSLLTDGRILWTHARTGMQTVVDPRGMAAVLFPELAHTRWVYRDESETAAHDSTSTVGTGSTAGSRSAGEPGGDEPHKPPPPRVRPTRLQVEHARRKKLRERNRVLRERAGHRRHDLGYSPFENRLELALVAHENSWYRERDRLVEHLTRGPLPVVDHPLRPPSPPQDQPPF